ncbi:MAG: Asp23/Gls24 family envelope stress response protein [Porcipelethomonas sp.]
MNISENICSGCTKISENVLTEIAENAVNEIDGVKVAAKKHMMISGGSRISFIFKGGAAEFTVPVVINCGCRTVQCTEQIQNNIKKSIQDMTGIAVSKVNVIVEKLAANQ